MPQNRITVKGSSGASYLVVKARSLQFGEVGLSPMIKMIGLDVEKMTPEEKLEYAGPTAELYRKVLSRFMIKPRFFEGHPADCPEDGSWTTFEDMGEDVTSVYQAITGGDEAEAAAAAAEAFCPNPAG